MHLIKDIQQATSQDEHLQQLEDYIIKGGLHVIGAIDGILLKGKCIIIPK